MPVSFIGGKGLERFIFRKEGWHGRPGGSHDRSQISPRRASGPDVKPAALAAALILLMAGHPAAHAAPPLTAEQAIAAEKEGLRTIILPRCRPDLEEIVV